MGPTAAPARNPCRNRVPGFVVSPHRPFPLLLPPQNPCPCVTAQTAYRPLAPKGGPHPSHSAPRKGALACGPSHPPPKVGNLVDRGGFEPP